MESSTFALWLQDQMRARRIGRNALARLTGVSAGAISRITLHNHVPGVPILHRLADGFGVERAAVLELAGVAHRSELPDELLDALRDLTRRLDRLDPEERRAVLHQFSALLALVENRSTR